MTVSRLLFGAARVTQPAGLVSRFGKRCPGPLRVRRTNPSYICASVGAAWLTPAVLDGRWMVRVSIGALATEREHVAELWAAMQGAVKV